MKLTDAQLQAIAALWDATDEFAYDPDMPSEEQDALIVARNNMGRAFPCGHPLYALSAQAPEKSPSRK